MVMAVFAQALPILMIPPVDPAALLRTPVDLHILVLAVLHPEGVAAVGLTAVPAPVNNLPHKVVTTSLLQAADQGGTLILACAPAVRIPKVALPLREGLPAGHLQEVHRQAHVHQVTTGCLTMADGACPTVQVAQAADLLQQLQLLQSLLQLKQQRQLNLLLRQLHLQPNQVPLLPLQVNPHQPLVLNPNKRNS